MENEKAIGKKIRQFRLRSGISQMKLEVQIGLAIGSLSRIEAGETNPTKETLIKIIQALKLQSYEAADLFNIGITSQLARLIELSKTLSANYNIDDILQISSNQIAKELNLLGVGIFKVVEDKVFAHTFTTTWYTDLAMSIIKIPLRSIWLSLSEDNQSLVVESINSKRAIYTESEADLFKPKYTGLMDTLQKLIGLKSMIVYPLYYQETPLGAIVFAKNYVDSFDNEKAIFKEFAEHISVSIANAKKYNELVTRIKE